MANNHGRDFGAQGLETRSTRFTRVGFPPSGSERERGRGVCALPDDGEGAADRDLRSQPGDRRGAARALGRPRTPSPGWRLPIGATLDRLLAAVRDARVSADTVVVYLHWGTELLTCPTGVQKTLARELHDAGADVIVGSHAHRVQGDGFLDGAFVGVRARQLRVAARQRRSGDRGERRPAARSTATGGSR